MKDDSDDSLGIMRCCFNLFGIALCLGLYALIGFHFYAFIVVVCPLIKLRLGTEMGLMWIAVGMTILYNLVFNHFWAMVIKPGSSKDQHFIEKLRVVQKSRAYRKSVN